MDITLNPVSVTVPYYTPPVTTTPPAVNSLPQPAFDGNSDTNDTSDTVASVSKEVDSRYNAAEKQIAQSFAGTYAVSDKDFSIFKDATGKYITRYVSLRDGSVTYSPSAPAYTKPPANSVTITA